MTMTVHHHRRPLVKIKEAMARNQATIGFLGTSVTDASPRHNWPEPLMGWFVDHFPDVRFTVENAGIGATASDLGALRVDRDILAKGCHLVFVEFAVNDDGLPGEFRRRTREGLLRKLLEDDTCDVVLVYTYSMSMYEDMSSNRVPSSVAEFEELAQYYDIPSVWMGLYGFNEVRKGYMRFEEWVPDGLHPTQRGSYAYAKSVMQFLQDELKGDDGFSENDAKDAEFGTLRPGSSELTGTSNSPTDDVAAPSVHKSPLKPALHPLHWGKTYLLPLSNVNLYGPWVIRRNVHSPWMEYIIDTASIGAKLSFDFEGQGLALGTDFGKAAAEYRYRIDDGQWIQTNRERPDWCGDSGWFRLDTLAQDLAPGKHRLELVVVHGNRPECRGTNFRLGLIGVLRYENPE